VEKNFGSFKRIGRGNFSLLGRAVVRLIFASAFRSPKPGRTHFEGPHEAIYEVGDGSLVPEKSFEGDFGLHYHNDNLTVDLAGFYNRVAHYIYISQKVNDTLKDCHYQYMQNNSALYGGEAGIHLHPKVVEGLHLEGTFSSVRAFSTMGNFLPFIPANKIKWR
jgi:iron complex outermembrane receptor protein